MATTYDDHDEDEMMSTSDAVAMKMFGAGAMLAAVFGIMGA